MTIAGAATFVARDRRAHPDDRRYRFAPIAVAAAYLTGRN